MRRNQARIQRHGLQVAQRVCDEVFRHPPLHTGGVMPIRGMHPNDSVVSLLRDTSVAKGLDVARLRRACLIQP